MLSRNRNRLGYGGYSADSATNPAWYARHRTLISGLGRWSRRDDGDSAATNLYFAFDDMPLLGLDPYGQVTLKVRIRRNGNDLPKFKITNGGCGGFRCDSTWEAHGTSQCKNWIVIQKLIITARCGMCASQDAPCAFGEPMFEQKVYESWKGKARVDPPPSQGPYGPNHPQPFDVDVVDSWVFPKLPDGSQCGKFSVVAEARLYCVGDLPEGYGKEFTHNDYPAWGGGCSDWPAGGREGEET